MIGEILNDKYKIEEAISESHMYEVYSALEIETGVEVAVKVLKEEMIVNSEKVKTFTSEIQSFASLSHPDIAEILDIDMFGDRPYVVTELVYGKDLHRWIKEDVIPFSEVIDIVKSLTNILQYAHGEGVHERTIKLSNVLRTDKKKLTLLSFTFPRLRVVGQRNRAKSEKSGVQSDLFFLGTTLYELLSGKTPIRRRGGVNELWDTKLAKQLRIRHSDLEPKQIDEIIAFIDKTLTRKVCNRFKTHAEFLTGLADITGSIRKAKVYKRGKQLSMASQVVDAINGKMSNMSNVNPISLKIPRVVHTKTSNAATASLNSENSDLFKKLDIEIQDYAIDGNLALQPELEKNEVSKNTPKKNVKKTTKTNLRLVKAMPKRAIPKKKLWRGENSHWLRNPLIIMGFCLIIMVLLVIFW